MEEAAVTILTLAWAAFVIWVVWLLYIGKPIEMARARRRSPAAWVAVGIFLSPFVAIPLLFILGEAE
ncbi:hypothetical protein NBRC116586_14660 [Pseudooceanicola nitratireducens]|uniref:hypothetical protein n=1 Tax=Pseudooceanicola nitratireducens TaxID=517719 RepID=UPI00310AB799